MWRLLQLADSAFPTGGFAHSGGLEAAVALGEVDDLPRFLLGALWQATHAALPFVARAHAEPAVLGAVDEAADAFLVAELANRASRAQGRALVATTAQAFGPRAPEVGAWAEDVREGRLRGHLAPLQGALGSALGLSREETLGLALFGAVRGIVSAAVRLGRVGPLEAQALLAAMPFEEALRGVPEEATQTAPVAEVCAGLHGRLYSRLFQS